MRLGGHAHGTATPRSWHRYAALMASHHAVGRHATNLEAALAAPSHLLQQRVDVARRIVVRFGKKAVRSARVGMELTALHVGERLTKQCSALGFRHEGANDQPTALATQLEA